MSYYAAAQPKCVETTGSIGLVIEPRERDLGGFSVRRVTGETPHVNVIETVTKDLLAVILAEHQRLETLGRSHLFENIDAS